MSEQIAPPQFWSTLPPLPLRGLQSRFVESLSFYELRLSLASGASPSRLARFIRSCRTIGGPWDSEVQGRSIGMATSRADVLERLTGVDVLKYGTFWVLGNVVNANFLGGQSTHRRWCPKCYALWDDQTSYEPLIWTVSLLSRCPRHGCSLESRCFSCGSHQPQYVDLRHRRVCVLCKATLGGKGQVGTQHSYKDWADTQICELVSLCAEEGRDPLPESTYRDYVAALRSQIAPASIIPAHLRSTLRIATSRRRTSRPSLSTMINLCAMQAVSVRDMLTHPKEAGSMPLVDFWGDYASLTLLAQEEHVKVFIGCELLKSLMRRAVDCFLPPIDAILRDVSTNRASVRDFNAEIYECYEEAYRGQASPARRQRLSRAFRFACRAISDLPTARLRRHNLWNLPEAIAHSIGVAPDEAREAVVSSLLYIRMLRRMIACDSVNKQGYVPDPEWMRRPGTNKS